jgi:ATP-dependent DNA helicase RecQ
MAWLAEQVPELPGHGIIYTLTVKDADQVAEWLTSQGIAADSYTGESGERREALEQALLDNRVKALVATTALGMGFDKPDLAFVIHYQAPGSVVAYYQQVGRAGRALEEARGVLLNGEEDGNIQDSFIFNAFPTRDEVCAVLETLESSRGGSTAREMTQALGIRKGRIDKTLALLSLELPAPIRKKGSRWYRAEAKIRDEFFRRAERITTLRRREQHQMREYVSLPSGHMEFLIRALDGDPGQVQRPRLSPLASTIDPDLHREAQVFLRQAEWARPGFRPRRGVRSG